MNRQGSKDNPRGGIEWTHILGPRTGATANPVSGCEHRCLWKMPDGKVAQCYAKTTALRFPGERYRRGFEVLNFWPDELEEIRQTKAPRGIFIDSMSDLFGRNVKTLWIDQVILTMADCPRHVFFSLTKNPSRFLEFRSATWPANWLVGISAPPTFMFGRELSLEQQRAWLKRGLEFLRDAPAKLRWISIEPLSFDVADIIGETDCPLDWAVIGAATNGAECFQPTEKHLTRCLAALNARNVPAFFKGNLDRRFVQVCGSPWREEFPKCNDRTQTRRADDARFV